jgi:hypothetical protein
MDTLDFTSAGRRWRTDLSRGFDLAIALEFDGPQPRFFTNEPASDPADLVVSRQALEDSASRWMQAPWMALVVRTLPNEPAKRHRHYVGSCPAPYFTADAMRWIVARDVASLVTELAFVPETAADGLYLLDLQVPAFAADAAPSRPVLYPVAESNA